MGLFSKQVTIIKDNLPLIVFDASITENHQRRSEATKFQTENGQTISDHIVVMPFVLSLQVLTSDSPISPLTGALTAVATAALAQSNVIQNAAQAVAAASVSAQALAGMFSPSQGVYQQVLALQDGKFPFDVMTSIGLYRNMWVENVGVPRDNKTGGGLIFNLELVQLLLVSSLTVNTALFANASLAAGQAEKGPLSTFAPDAVPSATAGLADALGAVPTP